MIHESNPAISSINSSKLNVFDTLTISQISNKMFLIIDSHGTEYARCDNYTTAKELLSQLKAK